MVRAQRRPLSLSSFFFAVLGAGLLAAAPGWGAATASAPDSASLAALRADLSAAKVTRVTATSGAQMLRDVRLDAHGVSSARWAAGSGARPALFVSRDVMPPPTPPPIPWSEISRIETGSTNVPLAAAKGLVFGAMIGTLIWYTIPTGEDGSQGQPEVIIGVPALAGLALGAFLGSQRYHWSPIYPRSTAFETR